MAKVRRSVLAIGVIVAFLALLPWPIDMEVRALLVVSGFAIIVAAFPGYGFLLRGGRYGPRIDQMEETEDDRDD